MQNIFSRRAEHPPSFLQELGRAQVTFKLDICHNICDMIETPLTQYTIILSLQYIDVGIFRRAARKEMIAMKMFNKFRAKHH